MQQVYTIKGNVDLDSLEIVDRIELFDNCRKITTEYRLNGEVVRTDIAASMLRGPAHSPATPGKMS